MSLLTKVLLSFIACLCNPLAHAGDALIPDVTYRYSNGNMNTLDVYKPVNPENAPVIMMVHGGGWKRGDKAYINVVKNKAPYFLSKGYIFVSVNYTLVPDANPIEQTIEILKAAAYIQNNSRLIGADPKMVNLMGHSAGAHLSALAATSYSLKSRAALRYPLQSAVLLDSAGYDIVKVMQMANDDNNILFDLYRQAFGDNPKFWQDASPYHQLKADAPPMMLVCSKLRKHACEQAYSFYDKLLKVGNKSVLYPINFSHAEINNQIGLDEEYTKDIHGFLGQYTGK